MSEADTLAEALAAIESGEADAVELASAVLPSCNAILLAALVAVQDGLALTLGRWQISPEGQHVAAAMPLPLRSADLGVALALLAEAEAALPAATLEPGETLTLSRGARLLVELACPPDGALWLALGLCDGSGMVALPVADRGALRRVLGKAGAELARAGLMAVGRERVH